MCVERRIRNLRVLIERVEYGISRLELHATDPEEYERVLAHLKERLPGHKKELARLLISQLTPAEKEKLREQLDNLPQ